MRRLAQSTVALGLAVLAVAGAGSGSATRSRPSAPWVEAMLRADATARPSAARLARQAQTFSGGPITAGTGETVQVEVSDSYPPDQVSPQSWADFFAGLVHGIELSLLTVYVEPIAEVQATCGGSPNVIGC